MGDRRRQIGDSRSKLGEPRAKMGAERLFAAVFPLPSPIFQTRAIIFLSICFGWKADQGFIDERRV
jgi:hypothetical protein